jgi:ectoine hydroxylase-related dioxygenase (phytanoyl-CoA dioxygenase family)
MTIEEALHDLGVRPDTLSPLEKETLDREGFLYLRGVLPPQQAERMRETTYELFARQRAQGPEAKTDCEQIQNQSDVFDICFTHPRVLAAVYHVIRGDLASQGVHSRPNCPGKGHQGLHLDGPAVPAGQYETCNSMWPLADFTAQNGATRVVPGSHLWGKAPQEVLADVMQPHPDEVRLIAPVGTVVVFNGHLWHASSRNDSDAGRPNVTSFWSRRDKTHFDATPDAQTAARMSPAVRRLFPG